MITIGQGISIGQGINLGITISSSPSSNVGNTQSNFVITFANTSVGYSNTISHSPYTTGSGLSFNLPATQGSGNQVPTNGIYSYLSVAAGTKMNFGTGPFTIEWFEYMTTTNNFPRRLWYSTSAGAEYWGFDIEGSTPYWWSPGIYNFTSYTQTTGSWNHFALVRSGTSLTLYINGIAHGSSVTSTTNFSATTDTLYIGGKPGGYVSEQFIGYMNSIRIVNGLAVYTGNFTVPTGPLGQTASANPYGGANTAAITTQTVTLIQV